MYYFTFRSVTPAQRAKRLLDLAGVSSALLRTPRVLAGSGCGYAIRLRPELGARAAMVLRQGGAAWSKCWQYSPPEDPQEVRI